MEKTPIDGLTIFFPAEERAAAELVRQACEKSISLIRTSWGLETPEDVGVYVLTESWLRATFHSAPWRWRPVMFLSLPVWYPRSRRLWRVAGGWQQSYGRRCAVCVKTPRLLAQEDSSTGDRVYIREADIAAKVQQITCHELTHAFTAHLKLPTWLNEGLAMVTAERFAGKPMVRRDSLVLLEPPMAIRGSMSRQAAKSGGQEAVVALYARGYWRTRYLEETRPGLLRDLFAQPVQPAHWENAIANACNTGTDAFWSMADTMVVDYFLEQAGAAQMAAAMADAGYNAKGHFVEF